MSNIFCMGWGCDYMKCDKHPAHIRECKAEVVDLEWFRNCPHWKETEVRNKDNE